MLGVFQMYVEKDDVPQKSKNTLDCIGNTPLVKLNKIVPENCANIFVKLEYFNPTGSKKDRMALAMVEGAEKKGLLKPGMKVVELSGGSTGAGLAFVCSVKGYKFHVVSSDAFSKEKLDTMTALGAELDIIESDGGKITRDLIEKMVEHTNEIALDENIFFTNQLKNSDLIDGFEILGKEILEQLDVPIDGFCDSVGTAGSLMGVSRALKKANQKTKIVVLEPSTSPIITTGKSGSHTVEGIGLGFVPELLDKDFYDEARVVDEKIAREIAVKLAREEGIFGGTSTGMNVAGAIELAKELGPGKTVVAIACDSGLKYLSETLYAN